MKNKDVCLIGKDLVLRRAINDGYNETTILSLKPWTLVVTHSQTRLKDGVMIEKQGTFLGHIFIDIWNIDI